jgi:hypothetical protein
MNNSPLFLINNILLNIDKVNIRKELFKKSILTKEYIDDGLILLYYKFDSPIINELQRECRSLILNLNTLKIVSYSCETSLLNKDGLDYLIINHDKKKIINDCYEGTYLSLFNFNDKWYLSSRRCLDSKESKINSKSHFEMFEEVLKKSNYKDFDEFTNELSKDNSYYFILIHHENKHIIDYTYKFDYNYTKLCLSSVKDSEMIELLNENYKSDIIDNNIILSNEYSDLTNFDNENNNIDYSSPKNEGIIIKIWNNELNKYNLIKLQYINYQFALNSLNKFNFNTLDTNIYKGFLYLYQNEKLLDFISKKNFNKIQNPFNENESYDLIGLIDSTFKVCTSELFELFKKLWSLKDGKQQNNELYNLLPKEYKYILYGIKGIYYKKKSTFDITNINNSHLKINDIWNYLKIIPIDILYSFIRMRKLMFNYTNKISDTKHILNDFNTISKHCNKLHIKLTSIYTNKLFPLININDFPPSIKI